MENREEIYKQAIKKWGEKAQMEMAQEEATELALAVRKQIRDSTLDNFNKMIGEIADVEIMIEQLQLMHGGSDFRDLVEEKKEFKLNRLKGRLGM